MEKKGVNIPGAEVYSELVFVVGGKALSLWDCDFESGIEQGRDSFENFIIRVRFKVRSQGKNALLKRLGLLRAWLFGV